MPDRSDEPGPSDVLDAATRIGSAIVRTPTLRSETLSSVLGVGVQAHRIRREQDLAFIHPYDDSTVIAGQGTVALEMLTDAGNLDAILVPVDGGACSPVWRSGAKRWVRALG